MSEPEQLLAQVADYLRDALEKEKLSVDVEKYRKILLEQVDKFLNSGEKSNLLRRKVDSKKRASALDKLSCDGKDLMMGNPVEGGSKRNSKLLETPYDGKKCDSIKSNEPSDSCEEADYESSDDRMSLHQPMGDRRSESKRNSKLMSLKRGIVNENFLANKSYEGCLYRKGKLNGWRKMRCVVSEGSLAGFSKDSKQIFYVKLEGYDVTNQKCKEGSRREYEIKLAGPGLKTYLLYADDKLDADAWVAELMKEKRKYSVDVAPGDDASLASTGTEAADRTVEDAEGGTRSSVTSEVSTTKAWKLHSLLAKVKQKAFAAFDSLEHVTDRRVSGVLSVTFDDLSNSNWNQRFCIVRSKHLEIYKSINIDKPELLLSLPGAGFTLIPNSDFFILCLNQAGQKVFVKFNSHPELNKWYQIMQKEALVSELLGGRRKSHSDTSLDSSLYAEIGELECLGNYGDEVMLRCPQMPTCPAPATPDVMGAILSMEESGYMDVLECRRPVSMPTRQHLTGPTYEEICTYMNRDDPKRDSKPTEATTTTTTAAKNSESRQPPKLNYCRMSKGKSGVGTTATNVTTPASKTSSSTTSPPSITFKQKGGTSASTQKASTVSSATIAAKKDSTFLTARQKFTQSPSSPSSKSKTPASTNHSPRTRVNPSSTNRVEAADGPPSDLVKCQMRHANSNPNCNSLPRSEKNASKRNSECCGKSGMIQERMKVFQKNS